MNFMRFLARKLAGLPAETATAEVLEAMRYSPPASAGLSYSLLAAHDYDLARKEVCPHTPTPRRAVCMTSAELEAAAAEIYRQLGDGGGAKVHRAALRRMNNMILGSLSK